MKKLLAFLLALTGFAVYSCNTSKEVPVNPGNPDPPVCYYGTRVSVFEAKPVADENLSAYLSEQMAKEADIVTDNSEGR